MNQNIVKNLVKVVNRSSSLELPEYQTPGSDGLDVMACFDCTPIEDSDDKYVPVVIFSPKLVPIDKLSDHGFKLAPGAPLFMNAAGDICTKIAFVEDLPSDQNYEEKRKVSVDPTTVITLLPGERALIPTGLSTQMSESRRIHVSPRSGLSLKSGITVLNSPGKVDSDYTGVIGVILINHGNTPFRIKHGDRIAQIALEESHKLTWELVGDIEDTERGSGGFGSTGVSDGVDPSEVTSVAPQFEVGELLPKGKVLSVRYSSKYHQFIYQIEVHNSKNQIEMIESDIIAEII